MLDEEQTFDAEGDLDEIEDSSTLENISIDNNHKTPDTPIRRQAEELFASDFVALNETEAALYPRYLAMYIPGCKDFTGDGEPLQGAMQEAKRWVQSMTNQTFRSASFKESLKSGVILCRLLDSIIPNSCPTAVTPPTDEVAFESKAMSNIMTFLEACSKKFQLQKQQIFDMDDLLGNGDISNVVVTLYWLGRVAWQNLSGTILESDRLDLFAFCSKMKCSRCRNLIQREDERGYGFSLTKQWHLQCESCKCCGSPFLKNGDEEVLCFTASSSSAEDSVEKAPSDTTITSPPTTYVYCLSCACARCSSPFRERNEYIKTEEGARICPDCYALTLCASCFQVLIPETKVRNEVDGKEYCKDCICARPTCRKIFDPSDEFVMMKDGSRKFCVSCICSKCQLPLPAPGDDEITTIPDSNTLIHTSCYSTKDKCIIS